MGDAHATPSDHTEVTEKAERVTFKIYFYLFVCVCIFVCLGIGSPGAGGTGGGKLPDVKLGTEPGSSAGAASALNC